MWGVYGTFHSRLKTEITNHSANWSGRRESNPYYQLGNLNFRSFIFNTYKTAQEKSTCMRCIQCMQCLICVSLRDVLRDGVSSKVPLFDHANSLFLSDHCIARLYHRGDFFAFVNTDIVGQRWCSVRGESSDRPRRISRSLVVVSEHDSQKHLLSAESVL